MTSSHPTIYAGSCFQVRQLDSGLAELVVDARDDSANKFSAKALGELRAAVDALKAQSGLKGVLVTSGKPAFMMGADVTEFLSHFNRSEAELADWLLGTDRLFSDFEDLPCPTVVAITGFCLGGGMEFSLSATYRVADTTARVGLPETKLGIFPGWGGTVRLSRLCGADSAIEWICSGNQYKPDEALKAGAVDAVCEPEKLRDVVLATLKDAVAGRLDWRKRREAKTAPLRLNAVEAGMAFEGSKAFVAAQAGPNYPAPVAAIEAMQKGAKLSRDEALKIEAQVFARVAKTPVAASLVGVFLADQAVKKASKKLMGSAKPPEVAGVLGAGIMGGGIAYSSASKGVVTLMKDITEKQLALGLTEATKILAKQAERAKLPAGVAAQKTAETLGRIRAQLTYGGFENCGVVIEAIVENEGVKRKVLPEVEAAMGASAVLASNTSTISITRLAESLKRPERFCGMHFFNPVHRMPLLEIVRGAKTSDETIAAAVAFGTAMGKTCVVVRDCPGFLVNRVLFPYLGGFAKLFADGVPFERIDKVMETFGWPMGPAYLGDVVGIDTAHSANQILAEGYPDRMKHAELSPIEVLAKAGRLGQKKLAGFYKYVPDKKGPPKKEADPAVAELLAPCIKGKRGSEITDAEIVERMMIPMLTESVRALDEGIAAGPAEVDISLLQGLAFPPFRGGIFRWADTTGLDALCKAGEKYAAKGLGRIYEPPKSLVERARAGKAFYS